MALVNLREFVSQPVSTWEKREDGRKLKEIFKLFGILQNLQHCDFIKKYAALQKDSAGEMKDFKKLDFKADSDQKPN